MQAQRALISKGKEISMKQQDNHIEVEQLSMFQIWCSKKHPQAEFLTEKSKNITKENELFISVF
jgi:hypothetical protein